MGFGHRALIEHRPAEAEQVAADGPGPAGRRAPTLRCASELLGWARLWQGDQAGAEQAVQRYAHAGAPSAMFRGAQALAAGRLVEGVSVMTWAFANEPPARRRSWARSPWPAPARPGRCHRAAAPGGHGRGARPPCASARCSSTPATTARPSGRPRCSPPTVAPASSPAALSGLATRDRMASRRRAAGPERRRSSLGWPEAAPGRLADRRARTRPPGQVLWQTRRHGHRLHASRPRSTSSASRSVTSWIRWCVPSRRKAEADVLGSRRVGRGRSSRCGARPRSGACGCRTCPRSGAAWGWATWPWPACRPRRARPAWARSP